MPRTPAPRPDPRSTGEIRRAEHREERAEDHAEHVAERLDCAMWRREREVRDEARDTLLGEIREGVRAIRDTMQGNGVPGCRSECRDNTKAITTFKRFTWLVVAAVVSSSVVTIWALAVHQIPRP